MAIPLLGATGVV